MPAVYYQGSADHLVLEGSDRSIAVKDLPTPALGAHEEIRNGYDHVILPSAPMAESRLLLVRDADLPRIGQRDLGAPSNGSASSASKWAHPDLARSTAPIFPAYDGSW